MQEFIQPAFEKPPVVETVVGIQFDPIGGFTNAHLGAFWKLLGPEWPSVTDERSLPQVSELFGDDVQWQEMGYKFRIRTDHGARLQIRDKTQRQMIQVQNGRLYFNWTQGEGEPYPKFQAVIKPGFDRTLSLFRRFLHDEGLKLFQPNQWDVTYVNHILKGDHGLWRTPDDWLNLLGGFMPQKKLHDSLALESVEGEWHFRISGNRGRLHAEVKHGRHGGPDGPEVLILQLTARGPVREVDSLTSVDEGIYLGHDVIVDTFKRLTSDAAHHFWEEVV